MRRKVIVACDPSGYEVIVYRLKQGLGQARTTENSSDAADCRDVYVLESGQQVKLSKGLFEMSNGIRLNPISR